MNEIKYNISFKDEQRLVIELPGRAEVHLIPSDDGLNVKVFGPNGSSADPTIDRTALWSTLGHMAQETAIQGLLEVCAHAEARLRHFPEEKHSQIYSSFWEASGPYCNRLSFEWTDPDTTYSEDIRACISGFRAWYDVHMGSSQTAAFEALVKDHIENFLRHAAAV